MGRGLPTGRGTGPRAQRAGALRGEGTEPRGAGEDSTLATPPTTLEPGGPSLLPLDPTAQVTLAVCLGGLAGVQGPTAQPPISWQEHTLEVSSGGRHGLGRHSPWSQAGEGMGDASHLGQGGGGG